VLCKIAGYHAKALDKIGSSYCWRKLWRFYYGKGSSHSWHQWYHWILFEQASSRGHSRKLMVFWRFIYDPNHNQFINLASNNWNAWRVLAYQRDFYKMQNRK
jgi:hypothetical protein